MLPVLARTKTRGSGGGALVVGTREVGLGPDPLPQITGRRHVFR
jgi:hypothetical protein